MTNALVWIRQSQGDEDSVSLELQEEAGRELAEELDADNIDVLNLGVTTGFSVVSGEKDPGDAHRLDNNEQVRAALEQIGDGEYDLLIAYDQSRLCRDGWIARIREACAVGGCDIHHVQEEGNKLTRDIRHRIEEEVKTSEMEKAREAIQHRIEAGKWQGAAPTGFQWVDGDIEPDPDELERVFDLIDAKDQGLSHSDAADGAGLDVSKSTVSRILERREFYEQHR